MKTPSFTSARLTLTPGTSYDKYLEQYNALRAARQIWTAPVTREEFLRQIQSGEKDS